MVVRYTDTTGRKWAFGVQGTPYQVRIFRRVLSTFAAEIEAAVLSALSQRFPAPPQASAPTAQEREQEQPPVEASRSDDSEADRVTYYWEKF